MSTQPIPLSAINPPIIRNPYSPTFSADVTNQTQNQTPNQVLSLTPNGQTTGGAFLQPINPINNLPKLDGTQLPADQVRQRIEQLLTFQQQLAFRVQTTFNHVVSLGNDIRGLASDFSQFKYAMYSKTADQDRKLGVVIDKLECLQNGQNKISNTQDEVVSKVQNLHG
jgi:hypothetical protein